MNKLKQDGWYEEKMIGDCKGCGINYSHTSIETGLCHWCSTGNIEERRKELNNIASKFDQSVKRVK